MTTTSEDGQSPVNFEPVLVEFIRLIRGSEPITERNSADMRNRLEILTLR